MTAPPHPFRINLERAQVLLVDAAAHGMSIAGEILAGFGVRSPARAATADEAMRICNAAMLDLIVCEPALPGRDGYAFVRQLRRSWPEPNAFAPVLLVSAHTPRSKVEEARDCGANFMVRQPLSPRVLLDRILWIAQENRAFIRGENYLGPDRRLQSLGPPPGVAGRRKGDLPAAATEAAAPRRIASERPAP